MQAYIFTAGMVAIVTGIIHSVLGEFLIFRYLRDKSFVPTLPAPPLKKWNIRIIWASWHLVTIFGWAFGAVLIVLSLQSNEQSSHALIQNAAIIAFSVSSFFVLLGTKGRHPGWSAYALIIMALTHRVNPRLGRRSALTAESHYV